MNTKKIIPFFISLSAVLFFSSCAVTTMYTTLDVLRPALISFEPEAQNLLIVNNSVVQPSGVGHTSVSYNQEISNVEVAVDSLALFTLSVLAEDLDEKGFFQNVALELNTANKSNDFNSIKPLQPADIRQFAQKYGSDVVISLDRIKVTDELSESFFVESGIYYCALDAKYETFWSIHYPEKIQVKTILFKDSLFWESESYTRKRALERLPDREDALIDGAIFAGRSAVDRLTPYWEKADRYFFVPGDKQMQKAMEYVADRKWEDAIKEWDDVFTKTKSLKKKAFATNNIAIAYEVLQNYDKAIEYAEKSSDYFMSIAYFDIDDIIRVSQYVSELKQRKEEVALLKKQLGE